MDDVLKSSESLQLMLEIENLIAEDQESLDLMIVVRAIIDCFLNPET